MKVFYIFPFILLSGCASTPEQQAQIRHTGLVLQDVGRALQSGQPPPADFEPMQPQIINPSAPMCVYRGRC